MKLREKIKLKDYLLYNTKVSQLCLITHKGWGQCIVYIDHEDLMTTSIPQKYLNMIVKDVNHEKLGIINAYEERFEVPVLKIEVDHETQD